MLSLCDLFALQLCLELMMKITICLIYVDLLSGGKFLTVLYLCLSSFEYVVQGYTKGASSQCSALMESGALPRKAFPQPLGISSAVENIETNQAVLLSTRATHCRNAVSCAECAE